MLDITVGSLDFSTIRIKDSNNQAYEYDLKAELQINEHNLQAEFKEQASKYVYWTSILEQLRGYQESAELQEERVRANLYEQGRLALINEGSAKPTKDQVEAWLMRQEPYVQAREQVLAYSKFVRQLQYVVKAFEQRRDMLTQIGADQRKQKEYERNLNMI